MSFTRVTIATASSVLLLAALAACGSDGSTDSTSGSAPSQDAAPDGAGFPGASGKVAAVSGSTAQVQSDLAGQVAVSWSGSTTFTQQVDAALADVEVGQCVVVTTADVSGSPDGSDSMPTEVAASRVVISDPVDGSCASGFGGGGRPSGRPSDMPTDMPTDMPSGGPGGGGFGGFGTVGSVKAVSDSGFTVTSTGMPGSDSSSSTEVSVTVSSDTTYTTNADASAAAVAVGTCVSAQGDTDDTGALTATMIAVSDPVDGECTGGMGGMRGARGGGAS